MIDTPNEQLTQPMQDPTAELKVRISELETNVSSLMLSFNTIIGTHLPTIRDKIVALESAISGAVAPKLETIATDTVLGIASRVEAIEAWLNKTPQAHGAAFTPAVQVSGSQLETKPVV